MRKEKSCGAIVYQKENDKILFLIICSKKNGHYSYPKGHVENSETEAQTALREIKEETNLDVILNQKFRKVITYSPTIGVIKDVVYFLAIPKDKQIIKPQEEEVSDIKWLPYDEAFQQVTHYNEKQLLKAALNYILNE